MKLKDPAKWDAFVANNRANAYSRCVVDFARAWAEAIEARLGQNIDLADSARKTFPEVNRLDLARGGITGLQYGCVVAVLAAVWEHGEALRRYHNLEIQFGDEGERANEQPGLVLDPAMIQVNWSGRKGAA